MFKDLFKNQNLNKIYLAESLKNFGFSMINIFIPIYLLNLGYSLSQVALFYLVYSGLHFALAIPAGKLGAKFGFKYQILGSMPFYIIFFIMLFSLETIKISLYVLATTKAFAATFFWTGRHVLMAKFTDKGKRGSEISMNKIFKKILSLPGPLIGGYFLSFLNVHILLGVILIFLIFATIPFFFIKETKQKVKLNLRSIFKGFSRNEKIVLINRGIDDAMEIFVWPVYAFFYILNSYVILGAIKVISKLFSLISIYFSGKLFDKKGIKIVKWGGIASIIVWVGRFLTYNPLSVYIIDSFRGISHPFIATSITAECYELANSKHNLINFIVVREMLIHIGRVMLFGLVLVIGNLKLMLLMGIIYSLVYIKFNIKKGFTKSKKICKKEIMD